VGMERPADPAATPGTVAAPADPAAAERPADPAATPRAPEDRSRPLRFALAVIGTASLAIGVVGLVVPVLPTTPFLLLAAACYARASTRLYGWLLGQPTLGPIIAQWRESRSLAPGVKIRALAVVVLSFGASILLVEELAVRAVLAATGSVVALFLARIPTAA
jgi:uncharacterized membrane protein YbaN (DUF454 family)